MEDQNKTDQSNSGKGPISSGVAPGPGEHLVDAGLQSSMSTSRRDQTGAVGSMAGTSSMDGDLLSTSNDATRKSTDAQQWQWPRSDTMNADSGYGSRQMSQDGSRTMLQSAAEKVRGSRGAFLAGTVITGFLLQRILQSAPVRKSGARDRAQTAGSVYGVDASLESDRKYGLETAYAPDTAYDRELAGGSGSTGAMSRITDRVRQASDKARTSLQATTAGSKARLNDMGNYTKTQYERAKGRVDTMKEERPLLIGALGLVAGAGLGAMLATTRRENELLGDVRDKVVGKAKETALTQVETVKESAQRFVDFSKQEAERVKGELGDATSQAGGDQIGTQPQPGKRPNDPASPAAGKRMR